MSRVLTYLACLLVIASYLVYFAARPEYLGGLPLLIILLYLFFSNPLQSISVNALRLMSFTLIAVLALSLTYGLIDGQLRHYGPLLFGKELTFALVKVGFGSLVLGAVLYVLGRLALQIINTSPASLLENVLLSLGLGSGILTNLLLVIAFAGLFTSATLTALTLAILLIGRTHLQDLRQQIKNTTIKLEGKLNLLVFFALVGLLASYLAVKIKGLPLEFDSLVAYLNFTKNLVAYGNLPRQWHFSFGHELIAGYAWSLLGPELVTSLSVITGFLTLLALYLLLKKLDLKKEALVLSAAIFLNPAVAELCYFDDKVDLGLIFLALLATGTFITWLKKRKDRHLLLSGLLIGTGFLVKYTALFSICGFFAGIIYQAIRTRAGIKPLLRSSLIFVTAVALPFLIFGLLNLYLSPPGNLAELPNALVRNLPPDSCTTTASAHCAKETKVFDLTGLFNPRHWTDHLLRPLRNLTQHKMGRISLDPLLVSLLPFGLLIFKAEKSQTIITLSIVQLAYLAAWYLLRPQVLWYALAGLLITQILLLKIILSLISQQDKRTLLYIIGLAFLLQASYYFINDANLFFLPGHPDHKLATTAYFRQLQDLRTISQQVNSLELNKKNKILLLDHLPGIFPIPDYFIDNNRQTTINSNHCQLIFLQEKPFYRQKLQDLDINYLLVRNITPQQLEAFVKAVQRGVPECSVQARTHINHFLENNCRVIATTPYYSLYQIQSY